MVSKTIFCRSERAHAAGELVAVAQLLGDGGHDLVVALGFADRLDRLLLDGDAREVRALAYGGDDVLHLEGGVGRQDDVGVEAVVLEPGMLRDDALDARVLHGLDGPVAVVPAGDAARGVGPDHVDRDAALFLLDGIRVLGELLFGLALLAAAAVEDQRRLEDGVLDEGLGDELRAPGVDRGPAGLGEALGQIRVEEADAPQALGARHAEVGHLALVHAGAAEALHAQHDALEPAGLVRVRAAEGRAAEVVDDGRGVLGELAGEGLDGPLGHAALLGGPFRGLRDAVFVLPRT